MTKPIWTKKEHPSWAGLQLFDPGLLGRWQWRLGKFSIISPSKTTHGLYELFDGNDIERFETLKEAQQWAETLLLI